MKKLRAEIGRLFGKKYVWTRDFKGEVMLHRNRGGWCRVYDFTHVGFFRLRLGGRVDGGAGKIHYVERWYDYDEYRKKDLPLDV